MWTFKTAGRGSEENDEHGIENTYHFREFLNHCEKTLDRNIWTLKVLLSRTQIEMRNTLLETRGEVSLFSSDRGAWLNYTLQLHAKQNF